MQTTLSDLPTDVLREMLANTEKSVGRHSASARVIRRVIERREAAAQKLKGDRRAT
jgi:hypothetical protein